MIVLTLWKFLQNNALTHGKDDVDIFTNLYAGNIDYWCPKNICWTISRQNMLDIQTWEKSVSNRWCIVNKFHGDHSGKHLFFDSSNCPNYKMKIFFRYGHRAQCTMGQGSNKRRQWLIRMLHILISEISTLL